MRRWYAARIIRHKKGIVSLLRKGGRSMKKVLGILLVIGLLAVVPLLVSAA